MRVPRAQRLQPLWERLQAAALAGMNVGDSNQATNGEMWLLEWLAQRLDPAPVVFDVGANVGRYSLAVLKRLPGARLYAFEPSSAFDTLERTLGRRAATFKIALGADEGDRTLYSDEPGSELGSLYRRDLHRVGVKFGETETVRVRRLDTLCAELDVGRVDFLKIDTEGGDLDILRGAGELLQGALVRVIQFEFGGTALDTRQPLRDYFDLLEPAYRIHRLLPAGLWPLDWCERVEIAHYANYVALPSKLYGNRPGRPDRAGPAADSPT